MLFMCCRKLHTVSLLYPVLFGSPSFLANKHKLPMMLCGRAAILLLERPAETDGRFTNAGRAKRAELAAAHLQEIFFFFTPPLHCRPLVFIKVWRGSATFALPKWTRGRQCRNISFECEPCSQGPILYLIYPPVAINRQLFYSLDFANTFVHAAVGGRGIVSVCVILFGEIEKKSMNIYPLPSFPTSVIFSIGFRNESHQGCAVIGEGITGGWVWVRACVWGVAG